MTYDAPVADRLHRVEVALPRELVERFTEIAERRQHVRSALYTAWVMNAAYAVKHGRGSGLPRTRSLAATQDIAKVWWTQSVAESAEWTQLIRQAGSSKRAVVHAAVQAYVDADGDTLAALQVVVVWPRARKRRTAH